MRDLLLNLAGTALYGLGLAQRQLGERFTILGFHRVDPELDDRSLTITPDRFRDICQFVARHFEVMPLDALVTALNENRLPPRALAITFDDGYADNFEHAAPILGEFGLPATFFIAGGFVGSDRVAPWDRKFTRNPGWMSWDQVRQLADAGFEIGAHTVDHVDLGKLGTHEARDQIRRSAELVEEHTGRPARHFAYPFGGRNNMSEPNRALLPELGFRSCLSCYGGMNGPDSDPQRLQRVPVNAWYRSAAHLGLVLAFDRS